MSKQSADSINDLKWIAKRNDEQSKQVIVIDEVLKWSVVDS